MQADILRFAAEHLAPYRVRGDELIPDYCPFCHGGDSGDRYTFALNLTDGVYVCKRGGCGVKGRFETLAEHFGERAELLRPAASPRKQFVLPDVELKPLTYEIVQYFEKRKISKSTLEAFQLGSDEKGNIVFPFFRNGT